MKQRKGTILITIDGVRRKEIFDKNIAPYLNEISNKNYVKVIDNMTVANRYKISYPGYNDILSGKVNKQIISNHVGNNKFTTFFEDFNLKPTLSLSWCRFKRIYNTRRSKLKILSFNKKSKKINKSFSSKLNKTVKCNLKLPPSKSCYKQNTEDCETFEIFCYHWKKNKENIKCGHLGFVGSDNWAHNYDFDKYTKYITYYDKCIKYIWNNLYPETIILTTDHSRGNKYWANHYNNIPGSNNIWCFFISKNKDKFNNIDNLLSNKPLNTDIYSLMHNFIFNFTIKNEYNQIINIFDKEFELDEQNIARKYIDKDDCVLELGARYGSVSCITNSKLKNKYNHVVVEPDKRVWKALENNKINNNCKFYIIKGFISNIKLNLTNKNAYHNGYASTQIIDENSDIKSYTIKDIISKYKLKFNVLFADCEGCLQLFVEENLDFIKNLRMIIFEKDYPEKTNYNYIINILKKFKFICIKKGFHQIWLNSNKKN